MLRASCSPKKFVAAFTTRGSYSTDSNSVPFGQCWSMYSGKAAPPSPMRRDLKLPLASVHIGTVVSIIFTMYPKSKLDISGSQGHECESQLCTSANLLTRVPTQAGGASPLHFVWVCVPISSEPKANDLVLSLPTNTCTVLLKLPSPSYTQYGIVSSSSRAILNIPV